jgi:predicted N-acetyltransferase YhbS
MVSIREAAISDAHAICLLNREALGYDFPEEKTSAQLRRILHSKAACVFVAEKDCRVVGYIHAADYECCYSENMVNVMALAVDGSARRTGIGKMLLTAAEDWAREKGAAGIRLSSGIDRTGAHKFYESCGYSFRKDSKNFFKLFQVRAGYQEEHSDNPSHRLMKRRSI